MPESHGQTGYTGLLVETAASSDLADWKEMLNWGAEVPRHHPLRTRYPHRYLDQALPGSVGARASARCCSSSTAACSICRRGSCASSPPVCGVADGYFDDILADGSHLTRAIHYPPMTQAPSGEYVWADAHTDINLVTALPRATSRGLQLKTPDGWRRRRAARGSRRRQLRDHARAPQQRPHPGRRAPGRRRRRRRPTDRYSVVQFCHPAPWFVLAPLADAASTTRTRCATAPSSPAPCSTASSTTSASSVPTPPPTPTECAASARRAAPTRRRAGRGERACRLPRSRAPTCDGSDWIGCDELVADGATLAAVVRTTKPGFETDDDAVAASLFTEAYAFRVAGDTLTAFALDLPVPDVAPAATAVRIDKPRTAVAYLDPTVQPADADTVAAELVGAHLSNRSSPRCTNSSASANVCSGATSPPRARSRSARSSRRGTLDSRAESVRARAEEFYARVQPWFDGLGSFTIVEARRSPGLVLGPDELLSVVPYRRAERSATTAASSTRPPCTNGGSTSCVRNAGRDDCEGQLAAPMPPPGGMIVLSSV